MMRKNLWMLAAILICGAMTVLTSCSANDDNVSNTTDSDPYVEVQFSDPVGTPAQGLVTLDGVGKTFLGGKPSAFRGDVLYV